MSDRGRDDDAPWRTLTTWLQLAVCGFLDAPSLARLEICGGLGDSPRAWEAKAAGSGRGSLGDDVSTKRLGMMNARALGAVELQSSAPAVDFSAFAFTACIKWGAGAAATTATFPFMRLRAERWGVVDDDRLAVWWTASPQTLGQAAIAPTARHIFLDNDRRSALRAIAR